MEHPIKKAGTLLPKFFRVFTLYIMLTLSVFFGYTKLFGNVAPVVVGLPTDDVDAEEDTYFNSFVNSIMQFDSIDTDINLNLTTEGLNVQARGNVVVTLDEDISVEINDLDLTYNDQHAFVSAVYKNSNLYLAINDSLDEEKVWYSFDLSSQGGVVSASAVEEESTFKKIFDFLSQYLNLDMSFLDEFGQYIGIDFNNLDPTSIMSRLKIIEKERERGGYYFNISLGTVINAEVTCDENFNIETIILNPINLKGNVLSFDANVSKMNSPDIVIDHNENVGGIDLSPITKYLNYAKNLFENENVRADLKFAFENKEYDGTLYINTTENISAKFVTNIEGVDILIGYQNENVFVKIDDIRFRFDINDFDEIKDTLDELLLKYTNKTATDFVKEISSKYLGKDLTEINLEDSIYEILGGGLSSISKISAFLPQTTNLTEISFEMLWQEGIKIKLSQEDELLKSAFAEYADYSLNVEFSVENQGFEFVGEWFDISRALPLSNIVDKVLEKKQVGGTITISRGQDSLTANYFVDFADGVVGQMEFELFGERIVILAGEQTAKVKIGEIVFECEYTEIQNYLTRLKNAFGFEIQTNFDINEAIAFATAVLNDISIIETDDKIATIAYLTNVGSLEIVDDKAKIEIKTNYFDAEIFAFATENEIQTFVVTDDISDIFEKIENIYDLTNQKQFALNFDVNAFDFKLSGKALIDLENQIYQVKDLQFAGLDIDVIYDVDTLYLKLGEDRVSLKAESALPLIEALSAILVKNGIDLSSNIGSFDPVEFASAWIGKDISSLSLEEIVRSLQIKLLGSLDQLEIQLTAVVFEETNAQINIDFENNKISKVCGVLDENIEFALEIADFSSIQYNKNDYINLIGSYRGEVEVRYNGQTSTVEVELDLREGLYFKAELEKLGERARVILLGGEIYIDVGGLAVKSEIGDALEIAERYISLPQSNNAQQSILELVPEIFEKIGEIDLKSFGILGSTLTYSYSNTDIEATISLVAGETIQKTTTIAGAVDLEDDVMTKVENIQTLIENRIFEFDFELEYNGFDFAGKLKIDLNENILEISDVMVCGEKVYIRLEDKKLYFAYGNMKYKFDVMQNQSGNDFILKDFLTKILGDTLPVEFNFGRFESLLIDLRDKDWLELLDVAKLSIIGSIDDLTTKLYRIGNILDTEILNANIKFEENKLKSVDLSLYEGILTASFELNDVDASTISPLSAGDFENYSNDFVRGMLDSLAIETSNRTAYAFGGDIAIRYSNTDFYGDVVAMLVERENAQGEIEYVPAVAISTTALNLNTYIYLIEDTIYLDVHGLQIQADLTQNTIDEVMDFVEENFDISLSSGDALEATSKALHVILPAIDEIYATWINGGIQINIGHNTGDDNYDRLTYGDDSWFYDMVAKVFIDVIESGETGAKTVVPTQVVFGANIHDPNTKVYSSYDEYLLKENDEVIETIDTKNLNFAVYLRDIEVGGYFEDTLNQTFVFDTQDPTKVSKVKSNYGTTNLSDFNTYNAVLDIFDSAYSYVSSLNYKGSVDATIQNGNKRTTLGANIVAKLDDLPEGATSAFTLYGNKYLKVQGNIDASMYEGSTKKARHLLDVLYESNDSAALYATYSHDDYTDSNQRHIGKHSFKAKINNANLSGIVSIIVDMLDINLGDMRENLSIDKSYLDYRFVQTLLNIGGTDMGDEISSVDQTLSSVEEILKLIRNINLSRQEISSGLYSTTLSVSVDWENTIALLKLVWNEELSGNTKVTKLRQIRVENFVFGDMTISMTINLADYTESSFNYNTSATHINMSSVSDFASVAINTLNTKEFNFTGSTSVSIIGISAISVGYDLYARIGTKQVVENGKTINKPDVYMYLELSVGSVMTVTYDSGLLGHDYTTDFSFDSRISTLVFENNKLTITQKTHRNKGFLISAKDKTLTWSYNSDQIGSNIMKIMAQAIGLTNSTYNIISNLVESMNPYPSLEQTLLAFSKGTNQYTLKLNGESLTGDANFADMDVKLGLTTGYNIQFTAAQKAQYAGLANYERSIQFIDSIETAINIASGTVKIPVKLNTKTASSGSYKTSGGRTIYVNNYYRNNYINDYKTYILNEFANGNLS